MNDMIKIRELQFSEINLLQDFPPREWNFDIIEFLYFHFGQPYFYPVVAEADDKIAGFGNGIINDKAGWIGNIIVAPEFRRQGIGNELTLHLMEYLNFKGCTSQILIASDMGKNIYSRIGFKQTSEYHFFKTIDDKNYSVSDNIRKISEDDYAAIKKMDQEITGERRLPLIERYLASALIYQGNGNEIHGFILPAMGGGLIFARDKKAGMELLKYRLSQGKTNAIIPAENIEACDFLKSEGFTIYQTLPRMVLGKELKWNPAAVFNRATGYAG